MKILQKNESRMFWGVFTKQLDAGHFSNVMRPFLFICRSMGLPVSSDIISMIKRKLSFVPIRFLLFHFKMPSSDLNHLSRIRRINTIPVQFWAMGKSHLMCLLPMMYGLVAIYHFQQINNVITSAKIEWFSLVDDSFECRTHIQRLSFFLVVALPHV